MTQQLLEDWLDQVTEPADVPAFEQWLHDSPQHLTELWERSLLEAELFQQFRTSSLPSPQKNVGLTAIRFVAFAATVLAVLFLLLGRSAPLATRDPTLSIVAGTPHVEFARYDPGPNPFYIPPEEWPTESRLLFPTPATAKWAPGCIVRGEAGAEVTLRSEFGRRTLEIHAGELRVTLNQTNLTIGASELDLAATAEVSFVLASRAPQPGGGSTTLTIERGQLQIVMDEAVRTLNAGDQLTLD